MKTTPTPRRLGVMVIGLLLVASAPLRAQAPSEPAEIDRVDEPAREDRPSVETTPWGKGTRLEDRLAAFELFREGNRLFRNAIFSRAAVQYTAALAKWQHPAFNYNLALAQLNLGQDVEARENFERAIRHGAEPLRATRFEEAQRQLRHLEGELGRIRISCQTPGAIVTLDGVTLFTGPGNYQGWTRAKTHELTARAPDYLSESRQITVKAGATEQLELKLITLDEAADANRRWAKWKPWAVIGTGAAIAVAGGVFQILSSRNESRYGDEFVRLGCANTDDQTMPGCQDSQLPPDLSDLLTRARQQQRIAIGSYIVGGSVAAVGLVLFALNRPRLSEQRPSGARISIAPALSPDMLGLSISISP